MLGVTKLDSPVSASTMLKVPLATVVELSSVKLAVLVPLINGMSLVPKYVTVTVSYEPLLVSTEKVSVVSNSPAVNEFLASVLV